ncbi:hypothetical protein COCON_G00074100 [Conger conger]|uniref:Uncharacterized protein n=1 Tax=Conger conger TaxID=82655 RepID=A0A9Q1DNC1_CONCO|nr:hypothetical protein COCON_G00074100 [Conger conger]
MERDVVRVRAVVMTRDDSGWLPLGGGGLSHVAICKGRSPEDRGRRDYCIRGERLRDRAPVLECLVQRGLVYNKVNPIFHHWRVEDQKFGLTFQSPADAISFEQGLRGVIDRLERESDSPSSSTPEEGDTEDDGQASHTGSESSSNSRKEMLPKPITIVTSESSSPCFTLPSAAEDYGYGTQHAVTTQTPAQIHIRPVQLQPSQTSPSVSTSSAPPLTPPTPAAAAPSPLSPLSPTLSLLEQGDIKDLWGARGYEDYRRAELARGAGVGVSAQDKTELCVVRFGKEQASPGEGTVTLDTKSSQRLSSSSSPTPNAVTSPPASDSSKGSPTCCLRASLGPRSRTRRRGAGSGRDCGLTLGLSASPSTTSGGVCPPDEGPCAGPPSPRSSRCVYCRSIFSAAENGRGRCRDAPDPALRCLRRWTCVWCAESLLYHCASDPEGEFWEPCSCEDPQGGHLGPLCCARWAALLALSLFVPCMCCYLPLCACLHCGERCGCCGGRHKAAR